MSYNEIFFMILGCILFFGGGWQSFTSMSRSQVGEGVLMLAAGIFVILVDLIAIISDNF